MKGNGNLRIQRMLHGIYCWNVWYLGGAMAEGHQILFTETLIWFQQFHPISKTLVSIFHNEVLYDFVPRKTCLKHFETLFCAFRIGLIPTVPGLVPNIFQNIPKPQESVLKSSVSQHIPKPHLNPYLESLWSKTNFYWLNSHESPPFAS